MSHPELLTLHKIMVRSGILSPRAQWICLTPLLLEQDYCQTSIRKIHSHSMEEKKTLIPSCIFRFVLKPVNWLGVDRLFRCASTASGSVRPWWSFVPSWTSWILMFFLNRGISVLPSSALENQVVLQIGLWVVFLMPFPCSFCTLVFICSAVAPACHRFGPILDSVHSYTETKSSSSLEKRMLFILTYLVFSTVWSF